MADKEFGVLETEIKSISAENRVASFMGTTAIRDRMGDEIPLKGWEFDNYMRAGGPVLWAHKYDQLPIGKTLKIHPKTVNGMKGWAFDVEFATADVNPLAEQIWKCVQRGYLGCVSVGFQSLASSWIEEEEQEKKQREKDEPDKLPGKKFFKKELLELSLTPVPANPEALLLDVRKGLDVPKELKEQLDRYVYELGVSALAKTKEIKEKTKDTNSDNDPQDLLLDTEDAPTPAGEDVDGEEKSEENSIDEEAITKPGWEDVPKHTEIKYQVRDPKLFEDGSFRRIGLQKKKPKVVVIIGKLKGEDTTKVRSLRFPRSEGWSLANAKKWLQDHPDVAKENSDGEIDRFLAEFTVSVEELEGYDFTVFVRRTTPEPEESNRVANAANEEEQAFVESMIARRKKMFEEMLAATSKNYRDEGQKPDVSQRENVIADTEPKEGPAQPSSVIADKTPAAGGPEHIYRYKFRIVRK